MNDVRSAFLDELDRIIARAEARVSEHRKAPHSKLAADASTPLKRLHLLRDQFATERMSG
jgi:hypothetical protein